MYQVYVSRYAKNCSWFDVTVVSVDDVDIKDKYDRNKVVFNAKEEETGNTNKCIHWGRIKLNVGDKLQIYGYKSKDVFICRDFKRLYCAEKENKNDGS